MHDLIGWGKVAGACTGTGAAEVDAGTSDETGAELLFEEKANMPVT